VRLNYYYNELDPKSAPSGTCKGAETDSQAKFGKEIIAGVHRLKQQLLMSAGIINPESVGIRLIMVTRGF
jgi:hypothetical protein